jgi:hypothetical protein
MISEIKIKHCWLRVKKLKDLLIPIVKICQTFR